MKLSKQNVIKREPALAEQVADILAQAITSGEFAPGAVFPSEAELAKQLDVSRTVVREAMARMKHDGLLETRKGGRTKVSQDTSGLVFRLDADAHQDRAFLDHLYELRAIIEPEAAALAAARATKDTLSLIRKRYEALKKTLESGGEGTDESLAFHKAVIDASGNPHLASLINWVEKKLWSFIRNNDLEHSAKMILEAQVEHEAIVKAIENRDIGEARRLARKHVSGAARRHGLEIGDIGQCA